MENNTITFDPQKPYEWKEEDQVVLSGKEFSALINTIKHLNNTEISMVFKAIHSLDGLLNNVVKTNVESGLFKESSAE